MLCKATKGHDPCDVMAEAENDLNSADDEMVWVKMVLRMRDTDINDVGGRAPEGQTLGKDVRSRCQRDKYGELSKWAMPFREPGSNEPSGRRQYGAPSS